MSIAFWRDGWLDASAFVATWLESKEDDFHRPFTLDARNVIAIILSFLVSALALAAGVGGGAFFVPLFNLVLGFSIKAASSTSQAAVFGGSIASVAVNFARSDPLDPTKCLIDFDLALILIPVLLVGVDLGVMLNTLLPSWMVALGLVLLLSYMCVRTEQKGRLMWRNETHALTAAQANLHAVSTQSHSSLAMDDAEAGCRNEKPRITYPWLKFAEIGLLWAAFLSLSLLQHRYARCSWAFGAVMAAEVVLCSTASGLFIQQVLSEQRGKPCAVTEPLLDSAGEAEGGHDYRPRVLLVTAAGTCVSGAVAGILGLGGGMLFTPLLLEFGVRPSVATATANLLILFSSSSATIAWAAADMLNYQYAAIFFCICIGGAVTGIRVVSGMVKRSGRPSIIVLLLAGIMGTGALLTGVFGGAAAFSEWREAGIEKFHAWCP